METEVQRLYDAGDIEAATNRLYEFLISINQSTRFLVDKVPDANTLTVHTKDRSAILWNGIVHLEYERLLTPYPTNPEYRQQMIFNRWVHGFQVGLQPDVWAQWFLDELPASLIRNN